MDEKKLNRLYLSAIRSRKKSGARWQRITEETGRNAGSGDSPYRQYVGAAEEPMIATGAEIPKNFCVSTSMRNNEIENELKGRVRQLLEIAKQILTERQYAVFILLAVKDPALTEREIAKVLDITPGRVNQLSAVAMKKLQVAYETRTH